MKASDVKLDMKVSYHADSFKPPRYGYVCYVDNNYVQVLFDDTGFKERVYPFWLKCVEETQSQIEKDYDDFCDEMAAKIAAGVKLLQEAGVMAAEIGVNLQTYDDWSEMKEVIEMYIEPPTYESSDDWSCSF